MYGLFAARTRLDGSRLTIIQRETVSYVRMVLERKENPEMFTRPVGRTERVD
jgi:hypothetical protein